MEPFRCDAGHSGIFVTFTSFDHGCYESFDLRCRQYFSTAVPVVSGEPTELTELKQWYVSSACGVHGGQDAMKWALYFYMGDATLIKDMHIILASLKNS